MSTESDRCPESWYGDNQLGHVGFKEVIGAIAREKACRITRKAAETRKPETIKFKRKTAKPTKEELFRRTRRGSDTSHCVINKVIETGKGSIGVSWLQNTREIAKASADARTEKAPGRPGLEARKGRKRGGSRSDLTLHKSAPVGGSASRTTKDGFTFR